MQAFLNKPEVKKTYLNRVKAHQKADEIVKGKYWKGGKGCAVGCTIHGSDHKRYETELGIPEWLARTEDALFEGMSIEKSKTWPFEFLKAIKVGIDLEKVQAPFQIMVLEHVLETLEGNKFNDAKFPDVIKSIQGSKEVVKTVLELWRSGKINDNSAAMSAESAARSATRSATSAAWSAARSAESAARSAAWSAASAAYQRYTKELLKILRESDDK